MLYTPMEYQEKEPFKLWTYPWVWFFYGTNHEKISSRKNFMINIKNKV